LGDGIVLDLGLFPGGADRRIRADAELRDEIGDGAEDDSVVVEVVLDEIVEAVSAEGRPCASDGDGEVATRGDEFNDVDVGSFVFEQRGVKESAIVGRRMRCGARGSGLFRGGGAALRTGFRCCGRGRRLCQRSDPSNALAAIAAIARPYLVNLESGTVVFEVLFVIRFLSVGFGSKLLSWLQLFAA
jgi:hypothetical protein